MPEEPDEDDEASGLPPDPLDRVWFHPSEVGAAITAWRGGATTKRRDWGIALIGSLLSVGVTVAVLAAAGVFSSGGHPSGRATVVLPATPPGGSVANLVSGAAPSVVAVQAQGAAGSVQGSGVVVDAGRILTSAALVGSASAISVSSADGRVLSARVLGTDPDTDLALLAVDDGDLPAARLGLSDGLRVGDSVVALGLGGGDAPSAYEGIVSRLNVVAPLPSGVVLSGLVETDAHMGPNVAGGALVASDGSVVGILSAALPGQAVPINEAHNVVLQIESGGQVHHAWLGVWVIDAVDHPGGGAQITVVAPNSPAAAAGLVPGDVVTAVANGGFTENIHNAADLAASFDQLMDGDPATLTTLHGDGRAYRQVSLGDRGLAAASLAGLAA